MKNELALLCTFLEDITSIHIEDLSSEAAVETFGSRYCFCSVQEYLQPQFLKGILNSISEREIIHLTDQFRLHFIFFRLEGALVAFGPYCTDSLTIEDCLLLFQRLGLDSSLVKDCITYRSQFPITTAEQTQREVRALIRRASPHAAEYSFRNIAYG